MKAKITSIRVTLKTNPTDRPRGERWQVECIPNNQPDSAFDVTLSPAEYAKMSEKIKANGFAYLP